MMIRNYFIVKRMRNRFMNGEFNVKLEKHRAELVLANINKIINYSLVE